MYADAEVSIVVEAFSGGGIAYIACAVLPIVWTAFPCIAWSGFHKLTYSCIAYCLDCIPLPGLDSKNQVDLVHCLLSGGLHSKFKLTILLVFCLLSGGQHSLILLAGVDSKVQVDLLPSCWCCAYCLSRAPRLHSVSVALQVVKVASLIIT